MDGKKRNVHLPERWDNIESVRSEKLTNISFHIEFEQRRKFQRIQKNNPEIFISVELHTVFLNFVELSLLESFQKRAQTVRIHKKFQDVENLFA